MQERKLTVKEGHFSGSNLPEEIRTELLFAYVCIPSTHTCSPHISLLGFLFLHSSDFSE